MQALSQLSYTPKNQERNYALIHPLLQARFKHMKHTFKLAEWTGLEPATPGVTGRYSNQLNYHSALLLNNLHNDRLPEKLASPRGFEPRLSP